MNIHLEVLHNQLIQLLSRVKTLEDQFAEHYDKHLGIPHWQENGSNYINSMQAQCAKFHVHSHMLGNSSALIQNDEYHKNIIRKMSTDLLASTKKYIQNPALPHNDRILCHQIILKLTKIDTILLNAKPANDNRMPPRRP
jgi:hypothetical protein